MKILIANMLNKATVALAGKGTADAQRAVKHIALNNAYVKAKKAKTLETVEPTLTVKLANLYGKAVEVEDAFSVAALEADVDALVDKTVEAAFSAYDYVGTPAHLVTSTFVSATQEEDASADAEDLFTNKLVPALVALDHAEFLRVQGVVAMALNAKKTKQGKKQSYAKLVYTFNTQSKKASSDAYKAVIAMLLQLLKTEGMPVENQRDVLLHIATRN